MQFLEIPEQSWSKWTEFSGRASRSEYWYNVLWLWLILFVFLFTAAVLGASEGLIGGTIYLSPLLILSVAVRRLHDLDASGWYLPLGLLPFVGIVFFFWFMRKGTEGDNRYGPDPLLAQENTYTRSTVPRRTEYERSTSPESPVMDEFDQWVQAGKKVIDATVLVEGSTGSGTAFHIGAGIFITAAHVVTGTTSVRMHNHLIDLSATVTKLHNGADVAEIRADLHGQTLGHISWGSSSTVDEGQDIRIVGYPLDIEEKGSITAGIISKIISGTDGTYFVTDAAVNQGNSGGPLFDRTGSVVGVVTSKTIGLAVEGVALATSEATAQAALKQDSIDPSILASGRILSRNATIRLAMYVAGFDGHLSPTNAKVIQEWAQERLPAGAATEFRERLNQVIRNAYEDVTSGQLNLGEILHQLDIEATGEEKEEAVRLVMEVYETHTGPRNSQQDNLLQAIKDGLA